MNSVGYISHCCINVLSWDCLSQCHGSQVKMILCPMRCRSLAFKLILTIEVIVQPSCIYRVSQEEGSVFWEIIVSVILSEKMDTYMYPFLNGF